MKAVLPGVLFASLLTTSAHASILQLDEQGLTNRWRAVMDARGQGSGSDAAHSMYRHCARMLAPSTESQPGDEWEGERARRAARNYALCAMAGFAAMWIADASEWARRARLIDPDLGERPGPTGAIDEPSLGVLLTAEETGARLFRVVPVQFVAGQDEIIEIEPRSRIQPGSRIERLILNARLVLAEAPTADGHRLLWLPPGLYDVETGESRTSVMVPLDTDRSGEGIRVEVGRDSRGTPTIRADARAFGELPAAYAADRVGPRDTPRRRWRAVSTYIALGATALAVVTYGVSLGCEAGYANHDISATSRISFGSCADLMTSTAAISTVLAIGTGAGALTLWSLEAPDREQDASDGEGQTP